MGIVEDLTGMGQQGRHVFPHPRGAIPNDPPPHRLSRNQARLFHLLSSLAQLVVVLDLLPAEHMHDAITVEQVQAPPLGCTPCVLPPCPPRSLGGLAWPVAPRPRRTRWHLGPIDPQHQYGTAKATLGHAPIDLLTGRRPIQHAETLGDPIGEGVQALAAHAHAAEALTVRRRRVTGQCDRQVGRRLLHIKLQAACMPPQDLGERLATVVPGTTRAIRARKFACPPHRLHRARYHPARPEEMRTRYTLQGFAPLFLLGRMFDQGLGYAAGQLLAQGPDRLTARRERRCGWGQRGFDRIKPLVKPFVELLAQGLPLFSCTDRGERDNFRITHR